MFFDGSNSVVTSSDSYMKFSFQMHNNFSLALSDSSESPFPIYNALTFRIPSENDVSNYEEARTNIISAQGQTRITLFVAHKIPLHGPETTLFAVHAVSNIPNLVFPANNTDPPVAQIRVNLLSMNLQTETEVIAFGAWDLLAGVGGIISLLRGLVMYVNGRGTYNPFGFIHMCGCCHKAKRMQKGLLSSESERFNSSTIQALVVHDPSTTEQVRM